MCGLFDRTWRKAAYKVQAYKDQAYTGRRGASCKHCHDGCGHREEDSDVLAVLGDQRAQDGNWAPNYINRAVLVGTRIKHDSNASMKAKRPKYWTAKQGVPNFLMFEHGSVDVKSMPSYTLAHTDTNVKQCAYTALQVLGAQVQVLHTSAAFIYTKELEDAMQMAIHEAPLPMRLHRQYIMIQFVRSLLMHPDSAYVTGPYPRAAEPPEAIVCRGSSLNCSSLHSSAPTLSSKMAGSPVIDCKPTRI